MRHTPISIILQPRKLLPLDRQTSGTEELQFELSLLHYSVTISTHLFGLTSNQTENAGFIQLRSLN